MANQNKIQEVTLTVDNHRMVISMEGLWVDKLRENGSVASSVGVAWEELATHEVDSYMSFYESIGPGEVEFPLLRQVG